MITIKVCIKCNEAKDISEFSKRKTSKDGLYPYCKKCKAKDDKRYREENHEKVLIKKHESYDSRRDEINKKRRTFYHENKEGINEIRKKRDKEFRENNREYLREYHKEWRENNPESLKTMREKSNKSEGHKLQVKKYKQSVKGRQVNYKSLIKRRSFKCKVSFSPHERKEILNRDGWKCQLCGCKVHDNIINDKFKAHIDHIIPISKGGNSEPRNLQVLCRTCNLSKSNKIIL